MLTLGELKSAEAETAMLDLLAERPDDALIRDAAISGLQQRELRFLTRLLTHPSLTGKSASHEKTIRSLSRCIAESRDEKSLSELLDLVAASKERWVQYALLDE